MPVGWLEQLVETGDGLSVHLCWFAAGPEHFAACVGPLFAWAIHHHHPAGVNAPQGYLRALGETLRRKGLSFTRRLATPGRARQGGSRVEALPEYPAAHLPETLDAWWRPGSVFVHVVPSDRRDGEGAAAASNAGGRPWTWSREWVASTDGAQAAPDGFVEAAENRLASLVAERGGVALCVYDLAVVDGMAPERLDAVLHWHPQVAGGQALTSAVEVLAR